MTGPAPDGRVLDLPQGLAAGTLHTLRLSRARWDAVVGVEPNKAIAAVVGAWLLMAWGRFGVQGLSAPRAGLRFILVGVYAWLLVAATVYLVGVVAHRFGAGRAGGGGGGRSESFRPARVFQLTGLCHQPVVLTGIAVLFGSLLPFQAPLTVVAYFAIALWLPAMLVAAVQSMLPANRLAATGAGLAGYGVWLATAGRYLLDRVGHLV
ncbi:MAG: hypothetical protein ACR2QK_14000 [Acidimicrobiales bacterium]